jgi:hypothetical protein
VTTTRFLIAWASAGRGRDADRVPRAKEGLMLAWGGGRTPLAFVVALLVPPTIETGAPFPDRDPLLVFAAALVVASAALQGTTVAALARWLRLDGDEGVQREEQAARELLAADTRAHSRTTAATQRERGEVLGAERAALVHLYDADEIGEETMLRLRHEIDLEAQRRPDGTSRPNPGRAVPRLTNVNRTPARRSQSCRSRVEPGVSAAPNLALPPDETGASAPAPASRLLSGLEAGGRRRQPPPAGQLRPLRRVDDDIHRAVPTPSLGVSGDKHQALDFAPMMALPLPDATIAHPGLQGTAARARYGVSGAGRVAGLAQITGAKRISSVTGGPPRGPRRKSAKRESRSSQLRR